MSAASSVIRSGVTGGLIELGLAFSGAALIGQLFWPVTTLVALFLLRNRAIGTGDTTLGQLMLPGLLGMFVAFGTLLMVQYLPADREDGTLLRAKATPNGIRGYLIGGIHLRGVSWITLAWVLVLGLGGTQLLGASLGALIPNPRAASYVSLPVLALTAISGIFYPITALPGWVQAIGQLFPIYWLGLGMRSALLPATASVVEIGGSWRHLETLAVLGGWAMVGVIIAPLVLTRMARRESGSRVAARREKTLRHVG